MVSRKVVVRIHGGLGNQMFMYAFGRAFALRHKAQLVVDPSINFEWGYSDTLANPVRRYELEKVFSLRPAMLPHAKLQEIIHFPRLARVTRFNKAFPILVGKTGYWRYVRERHFQFDLGIYNMDLAGRVYFAGYWQSEKYFKEQEAEIRKDFAFRHPLQERHNEIVRAIDSSNSVCLHVRRGDTVRNPATGPSFNVHDQAYFDRAVALMKERVGRNIKVFIFSDEIGWCRGNFRVDAECLFIEEQETRYALQLMASCKHFIIPTSTLSWWGAWLSNYGNKTVIAPKTWFNDPKIDTRDICPERCLKI